jgi:hypothetical protein
MEIVSCDRPVLPPVLVDYIIFEYTDALGLVMLSQTCKKYRSEYITIRLCRRKTIYISYIAGDKPIPPFISPYICSKILVDKYDTSESDIGTLSKRIYPKITHPFTYRMIQKLLEGVDIDLLRYSIGF